MKILKISVAATVLLSNSVCIAQFDPRLSVGPFVDVSVGTANIDIDPIGLSESGDSSHSKTAAKVSAGYWFSEHWGASVNYVELGEYEQQYTNGTFRGSANSYGLTLLGRLPIAERWSLVGKINLTKTEMDDNGSTGGNGKFTQLDGDDETVVLPGIEINYHVNDNASVFVEIDPRGNNSSDVSHTYAGVGLRWAF